MNVYGSEVTEATVKRQPGYDKTKPIMRYDVAKLALEMINDEGKRDRARNYLKGLEDDYGHFNAAATKCLIYNATGATMNLNTYKDWSGHVGESSYPTEIKNGQWGVFFHHKPAIVPASSHGAVVYNLKDEYPNSDMYGVLSWLTGWGPDNNNCYAEMALNEVDDSNWNQFWNTMMETWNHHYIVTHGRLQAELTIGEENISEWTAVIKLLP